MCTVCGCAEGNTRIDGNDVDDALPHVDGPNGTQRHAHVAPDGTVHHHSHAPAHPYSRRRSQQPGKPPAAAALHFGQGPAHAHAPGMSQTRMVQIERDILARNDGYAASNRQWFAERGILALNLVSSPGAGKTTLLVRTIEQLRDSVAIRVVEGDQQTSNDAERIRATGVPAVQINTGKGCHLDAHMVGHAIERLQPPESSLLLIENVGNLVCPAAFDLGEAHKVVILSVTEGEDKPLKYPDMFAAADVMLLNKCDLLPHLQFDIELAEANARRVNPRLQIIRVSASSGDGMAAWLEWLQSTLKQQQNQRNITVDRLQQRILELERQLAERDAARPAN